MKIHLRDICSSKWLDNHQPPTRGLLIGVDASSDRDELIESFVEYYDVALTHRDDCDPRLAAYANADVEREIEKFLDKNDTVNKMRRFLDQIPSDADYGVCKVWFVVRA